MRLIAGSGRSGTTWVLDCLADANSLRPVFEPLHPAITEIGARYAYRLIDPEESHPELRRYFEAIQDARSWSMWTTYRAPREKLFPPIPSLTSLNNLKHVRYRWAQLLKNIRPLHQAARRKVPVIKCIRANLALGWFVKSFGSRVILIVRHPSAVVESQLRLGSEGRAWDPSPVLDRFRGDQIFDARTNGRYRDLLCRKQTRLQALTLLWVIENQIAVARAAELGYSVIYYEELFAFPDAQWRRVCDALALENMPTPDRLQRPSQQASRQEPMRKMVEDASWMARLNPVQLGQVQGILDETDCGLYDVQSAYPIGRSASSASVCQ